MTMYVFHDTSQTDADPVDRELYEVVLRALLTVPVRDGSEPGSELDRARLREAATVVTRSIATHFSNVE